MTATSPCYKAAYIFTLQSTLTWQTILRIDNICKLGRNMVSEKVKFTVGASTWDWNACEMAIFCLWNISRIFETCTTSRSQWYTHNISCVNLVKKINDVIVGRGAYSKSRVELLSSVTVAASDVLSTEYCCTCPCLPSLRLCSWVVDDPEKDDQRFKYEERRWLTVSQKESS